MANTSDETSFSSIAENIQFVAPGVIGGVFIYVSVRKLRHMAVLPICIFVELLLFYLVLWYKGVTVEQATDMGWIRSMDPPPFWYHTWDYLRFDKVLWSAFPGLFMRELSMIMVVALSSSLDVAAIELELNTPLDYNRELQMVGLSNLVSGVTGGYTGSYIFSQSIFSLRSGIRSRLAGYVLALTQVVFLVLPVPLLSYVPNFFFGSLLSMICIDLLVEWLWEIRKTVTTVEYIIALSTFALIQLLNVEYGMIAGVSIYVVALKLGLDIGNVKIATREANEIDALLESPYGNSKDAPLLAQYGSL
jgi:MFS superfamily sulfate permease-like transporter